MSTTQPEEPWAEGGHGDNIHGEKPLDQPVGAEDQKVAARPQYDDPFGDEEGAEVQYRTMTWW